MIKNIKTNTKEETLELGKKLSNFLFKGSVVLLCGDLGAGKTTLTKGIGKGLGVEEEINSPTFNILKCYFNKTLNLYHIDAYRLEDVPEENKNIGLEEVIDGDGCAIIEWPQFISEFIDYKKALIITITIDENNVRNFKLETENLKFEGLFAGLL
ncbi:MAG: tRNA (adenosine(37)-N6)-threonylcarbamoyltransferase complex ATPase subunit type 1 TsaE [Bacilli bacterium]|nr:tRNA (adenosine(37)-N6)-threonylcarbamoyltransferase complex ATPase subunit type 1 TsaE [Bacilli bacterium]